MNNYSWAYSQLQAKIRNILKRSPTLWDEIIKYSEEIQLQKGDTLIHQLERNKFIYIIVKGAFECNLIRKQHTNRLVWFFFDNEFDVIIGINSCKSDHKTMYAVVAMEASIVIKLEIGKMNTNSYQTIDEFYKNEILSWFFNFFEIRNNLFALPPMEFLDYLDSSYPVITKRVSSHKLAHFMGITPEWLSKLKKRRQLEPTR